MKKTIAYESLENRLLLTERGERWLNNFADEDKPVARKLISKLTLVSTTEFERELLKIIDAQASLVSGPIALFAVRELDKKNSERIFDTLDGAVHSTPRGTDIGSEGRAAALLRNHARTRPKKFLNHPTIAEMRERQCSAAFFIDDFIGSGNRVQKYLEDFYDHPTIRSWHSYGLFEARVLVYSGSSPGIKRVRKAKMRPSVDIVRTCPTLTTLLCEHEERAELTDLCSRYAKKYKLSSPLGYEQVGALLVFEHSCPNNCPQIFWGGSIGGKWEPMFPGKAVVTESRPVFPPEILRHEPVHVLIAARQHRMAQSAKNIISRPLPVAWLATLALFGKGVRRLDAVEAATGMNHADSARVVEQCVTAGLLTQRWRLTDKGRAELKAHQKAARPKTPLLKDSDEDYYPIALRNQI